jgi:hypothetical protein
VEKVDARIISVQPPVPIQSSPSAKRIFVNRQYAKSADARRILGIVTIVRDELSLPVITQQAGIGRANPQFVMAILSNA